MTMDKKPPFTCHRMDIPRRREKSGWGVLVSLIGLLACMVGSVGWSLWGAL